MEEQEVRKYDVSSAGVQPIGSSVSYKGRASTFLSQAVPITKCKFYIQKHGTPSGTAYAKLYIITGTPGSTAIPTGSALATSDAFDVSTIVDGFNTFTFTGAEQYNMNADTQYAITLEYNGGDGSNYVEMAYGNDVTNQNGSQQLVVNSSWSQQSLTNLYYVYGLFPSVYTLSVSAGSLTLTGLSVGLSHAFNLVVTAGSLVLTGMSVSLSGKFWKQKLKNITTWIYKDR